MATPDSMFGMSPLDVVQQRIQEQEKMNMLRRTQRAQEGSEFGIFAPLYRAGLGFGDIAGQALTQGVFGQQQDPMLKKAVDIQSVLSGKDVTKAEDLSMIAGELARMGYSNEAMAAAQQARTIGTQERELTIREEDLKLKRGKVGSEQTTTKGIRVFRRGDGPFQVEEGGRDVPYDAQKHGRFETATDRAATGSVKVENIYGPGGMVIGREVLDGRTGTSIRKEYFPGFGPNAPGSKTKSGETEKPPITDFGSPGQTTTETEPTVPVRSGRGRRESNRVSARPPREILKGTNKIKNKAYDEWTSKYGATHNPDGTPK